MGQHLPSDPAAVAVDTVDDQRSARTLEVQIHRLSTTFSLGPKCPPPNASGRILQSDLMIAYPNMEPKKLAPKFQPVFSPKYMLHEVSVR